MSLAGVRVAFLINPAAGRVRVSVIERQVRRLGPHVGLVLTHGPGSAFSQVEELARRGLETLVVVGGDGLVNEAVNGLFRVPEQGAAVRLAALPYGSLNVFAASHPLSTDWSKAWERIERGDSREVDLGALHFPDAPQRPPRYFAQLGGGGLDARALACVSPRLKRCARSLAYVWAGLVAMASGMPKWRVAVGSRIWRTPLVLVGLGRFYSRRLPLFAGADDADGALEYAVFPRFNGATLARFPVAFLSQDPARVLGAFRGRAFRPDFVEVGGPGAAAPLEVDGEFLGPGWGRFGVSKWRLRVIDSR